MMARTNVPPPTKHAASVSIENSSYSVRCRRTCPVLRLLRFTRNCARPTHHFGNVGRNRWHQPFDQIRNLFIVLNSIPQSPLDFAPSFGSYIPSASARSRMRAWLIQPFPAEKPEPLSGFWARQAVGVWKPHIVSNRALNARAFNKREASGFRDPALD